MPDEENKRENENTLLWFLQTELSELPDENKKESENSDVLYVIIGVLCFLLLCATLSMLIALSIKRWSKKYTRIIYYS